MLLQLKQEGHQSREGGEKQVAMGIFQSRAFIPQVLSRMYSVWSLEQHSHGDDGCTCLVWVLFEVYSKPTRCQHILEEEVDLLGRC